MNEKITSKDIEHDTFTMNSENSDYEYLISRLEEIAATIALLEQTISR